MQLNWPKFFTCGNWWESNVKLALGPFPHTDLLSKQWEHQKHLPSVVKHSRTPVQFGDTIPKTQQQSEHGVIKSWRHLLQLTYPKSLHVTHFFSNPSMPSVFVLFFSPECLNSWLQKGWGVKKKSTEIKSYVWGILKQQYQRVHSKKINNRNGIQWKYNIK